MIHNHCGCHGHCRCCPSYHYCYCCHTYVPAWHHCPPPHWHQPVVTWTNQIVLDTSPYLRNQQTVTALAG